MGREWVGLFCAGVLACGCAAASRPTVCPEQVRWESVCRHMQNDRTPAGDAPHEPVPRIDVEEQKALEDAARGAIPSIVHVYTRVNTPAQTTERPHGAVMTSERSGGTGVVIDAGGIILTNEHVVRDAVETWVVLPDGSWHPVTAVTVDDKLDLAILRIEACGLSALSSAASPDGAGEPVVALGCTAPGEAAHVQPGRITDMTASLQGELDPAGDRKYDDLIASSVSLSPGFSGGPLLNVQGRLIGLTVATSSVDGRPRGYAIPLNDETRTVIARLAGTPQDEDAAAKTR
jgi:serine protease Do